MSPRPLTTPERITQTFSGDFQPTHDFFIGIDSDGCVFDSMEIKHKECFAPMFIKHFSNCKPSANTPAKVWEFVNLYSKTRGCNRFHAVIRSLDLLRERNEVAARGVAVPTFPALREWVDRESKLGNATLDRRSGSTATRVLFQLKLGAML